MNPWIGLASPLEVMLPAPQRRHGLDTRKNKQDVCPEGKYSSWITGSRNPPLPSLRFVRKRSIPVFDLQDFHCVSDTSPKSPEVEGQGHCEDDAHQHQERQPCLQEASTATQGEVRGGITRRSQGEDMWDLMQKKRGRGQRQRVTVINVLSPQSQ